MGLRARASSQRHFQRATFCAFATREFPLCGWVASVPARNALAWTPPLDHKRWSPQQCSTGSMLTFALHA
jgi:hypothetical protein